MDDIERVSSYEIASKPNLNFKKKKRSLHVYSKLHFAFYFIISRLARNRDSSLVSP